MSLFKEPCGGCGETRSDRRCLGCFHEAIDWVKKDKSQLAGVRVKGLDDLNALEETLGALEGKHGEGWINISMNERRLFAKLLRTHISALETQEEEAVAWRYRLKGMEVWHFYPFSSFDLPGPDAYERSPLYIQPTHVQKEEEGQTVSEEMLERGIDAYRKEKNAGIRNYEDIVTSILTAALVKP